MTRRGGRAPVGAFFPGSSRKPIAHGTIGGYRAHYRHGVPMCDSCRDADRQARGRTAFRAARCGTRSGYNAHRHRGEQPCQPCKDAQAAAKRVRDAQQRARARRSA